MKKYLLAAVATAALAGVGVMAQSSAPPTLPFLTGAEYVQLVPNGIPTSQSYYGTSRQLNNLGPGLYSTSATAATAGGTTEQTLATYSLPANWLNYVGRKVLIKAAFHAASNGNNKTFKCYFGASVISSGVLTSNNKNGTCEMVATKTGASTQIVYANMLVDTTPITPYVNASGSDADTAAIVIKFTGTDGSDSAGDIVLDDFYVGALN